MQAQTSVLVNERAGERRNNVCYTCSRSRDTCDHYVRSGPWLGPGLALRLGLGIGLALGTGLELALVLGSRLGLDRVRMGDLCRPEALRRLGTYQSLHKGVP